MLLLATMINYMDRQTLANVASRIKTEFQLSETQYGNIEGSFGIAFAWGSLLWGVLADKVPVRLLYPFVLLAWSTVGFVTGWATDYRSLLSCRILLGFFESGHWPCALVVTHSILTDKDRALGNSVLQSGASIGAIITPLIILAMVMGDDSPGAWRMPFFTIGGVGVVWVILWFLLVTRGSIPVKRNQDGLSRSAATRQYFMTIAQLPFNRKFWAMAIMVVCINCTWQLIRAWLPKFLKEGRGYEESTALIFNSVYYIATDVGCILAGAVSM